MRSEPENESRCSPTVSVHVEAQVCCWCRKDFEPGEPVESRAIPRGWDVTVWLTHERCGKEMGRWLDYRTSKHGENR